MSVRKTQTSAARVDGRRSLISKTLRLDGLYALNLGNLLLENTFDTIRESQLRHRAAGTRTDETDLHNATFDVYELDVPAICLQGRTDLVEYLLDAFFHVASPFRFTRSETNGTYTSR